MEQFNRLFPPESQQSRHSSVSSLESINDSASSNYNGSTKAVYNRAVPITPSYMKYTPVPRKPVASKVAATDGPGISDGASVNHQPPSAPLPDTKGTLLLAIAASPHPSSISYLQSMLKKAFYKQILIIGGFDQETGLKKLKVDIYALLGKLGLEAGVSMDLRDNWDEAELSAAISKAVGDGDEIKGVLCTPSYENVHCSGAEILSLDQEQLESPWKSSIGFLHSIAKHSLPKFGSSGHEYKQPGLFLVTSPSENSPTSKLYNAGCRTLMTLLVEANTGKNLTIDYAENVFSPEPGPVSARFNGVPKLAALDLTRDPEPDEYPQPDSPTKLWTLYDEFAADD